MTQAGAEPTPAKAIFNVRLKVGIGLWKGEWTGTEQQYEDKSAVLFETESQAEAEAFYEKVVRAATPSPEAEGQRDPLESQMSGASQLRRQSDDFSS